MKIPIVPDLFMIYFLNTRVFGTSQNLFLPLNYNSLYRLRVSPLDQIHIFQIPQIFISHTTCLRSKRLNLLCLHFILHFRRFLNIELFQFMKIVPFKLICHDLAHIFAVKTRHAISSQLRQILQLFYFVRFQAFIALRSYRRPIRLELDVLSRFR